MEMLPLVDEVTEQSFHCKAFNCNGWWFTDGQSSLYACPVCEQYNCVECNAIHAGMSCDAFKQKLRVGTNFNIEEMALKLNWSCSFCTFENEIESAKCVMCNSDRDNAEGILKQNIVWQCNFCTADNHEGTNICDVCYKTNKTLLNKQKEFQKLQKLDDFDIIETMIPFECIICTNMCLTNDGIRLRCLHEFCKLCVSKIAQNSETAAVKCPIPECTYTLQDREILNLVTRDVYDKHVAKSFIEAKKTFKDGFECKTNDCIGFWIYEKNVYNYICPLCKVENCTACSAIHPKQTCREYQDRIFMTSSPEAIKTREKLESMLKRSEAMQCPNCKIIITKNGGCDHMKCTMCRTKFNWQPYHQRFDL